MRNTFAFAGPEWETVYINRVRRNANIAARWQQHLVPVNYRISANSLELGDLSGCEVTLCAPGTTEGFQHNVAEVLLKSGASMVAAVSDCGSISIYRGER